jgi:hypothetical protein
MTDNVLNAAMPRPKQTPSGKPRPIRRRRPQPVLRLTPYAWAKLLYLRDAGPTEIGGFGVSACGEPLLVKDVQLVRQRCDWASVAFEDAAVADFFDEQVDRGRVPEEFGRIWVHTHPGASAEPSLTDEETFARVFGNCDWAVMFILAQGGGSYARLQYGVGPGGSMEVAVEVDYEAAFPGSDREGWAAEYAAEVLPVAPPLAPAVGEAPIGLTGLGNYWDPYDDFRRAEDTVTEEADYAAHW